MKKNFEIDEIEAAALNTALTNLIYEKEHRHQLGIVEPKLALSEADKSVVKTCAKLQNRLAEMLVLKVSWRS